MKSTAHCTLIVALGAAALGGCAPPLAQLIDGKHYREAVCAGVEQDAAEEVTDALARDADAQVHIHSVTREELEPVLGGQMPHVDGRAEFVRVRFITNTLPVDDYQVRLGVEEVAGLYEASAVTLESLLVATKEPLPPNRTYSTYMTPNNVMKGAGAIFTVGISLLFTGGFDAEQMTEGPSLDDFERTAQIATRLYQALELSSCTNSGGPLQPGADYTAFFMLPRKANARWRLSVEQTYRAKRISKHPTDDCVLTHTDKVNLRTDFESATRPLLEIAE